MIYLSVFQVIFIIILIIITVIYCSKTKYLYISIWLRLWMIYILKKVSNLFMYLQNSLLNNCKNYINKKYANKCYASLDGKYRFKINFFGRSITDTNNTSMFCSTSMIKRNEKNEFNYFSGYVLDSVSYNEINNKNYYKHIIPLTNLYRTLFFINVLCKPMDENEFNISFEKCANKISK